MPRFSDEELRRYAPQMVLPEIGGLGQERLRLASVRASGQVEALYLAAAGVGRLTVPSVAMAEAVRALNPAVQVQIDPDRVISEGPIDEQALRALRTLKEALGL